MKFKKRKGFAMLVNLLIVVMIMGTISTSLAMQQSAYFTGLESGRTALQAQQIAATKVNEVSVRNYSDATSAAEERAIVTGTDFEREVLVGSEVDLGSNNKKRDITVNVYKPGETQARFSLPVTLTSQGSSSGGVPIGTVIIWPVSTMPAQGTWLECNGQSTSAYPALAAVVGASVPNYQGVFLRGYGSQPSTHYNTVTHSSAALGSLQGDAIRNITGWFNAKSLNDGYSIASGAFVTGGATSRPTPNAGNDDIQYGFSFDASRVVPTATENRPVNKAVRYLIKAA